MKMVQQYLTLKEIQEDVFILQINQKVAYIAEQASNRPKKRSRRAAFRQI